MSIPNLLSLFRLLLVPVFPLVFFLPRPDARVLAVPFWAVVVFFCKELAMAIGGWLMYRAAGDVISANWLGKAATGVFFVVCVLLVLCPQIPRPWATGLISFALALTIAAFFSYLVQFMKVLTQIKSD